MVLYDVGKKTHKNCVSGPLSVGWWAVLYDVGKKTHKNCVSGPLFACRVSRRDMPFLEKIADITMSGQHVTRHSQLRDP